MGPFFPRENPCEKLVPWSVHCGQHNFIQSSICGSSKLIWIEIRALPFYQL